MIEKVLRNDTTDRYNLVVTDKFGNSFTMMVGGNLDLYWLPNKRDVRKFVIDKEDDLLFDKLENLFEEIKANDGNGLNYPKTLNNNILTFLSEDCPEDEANKLEIVKEKNQFTINFIKNQNLGVNWGFRRGCVICFCNSGSRVPNVERLFMMMFNELAYYNDEVIITKN